MAAPLVSRRPATHAVVPSSTVIGRAPSDHDTPVGRPALCVERCRPPQDRVTAGHSSARRQTAGRTHSSAAVASLAPLDNPPGVKFGVRDRHVRRPRTSTYTLSHPVIHTGGFRQSVALPVAINNHIRCSDETLPGGRDPCQDAAPACFRAERLWPLLRTFTELALVYLRPPPRPMHSWLDDRGRRLRGFGKHRVRGLTAARPPLGRYGLWRRCHRDAQSADEVHSLMAWRTWPRTMCGAGSMTPGAARTIRVAGAPWATDCLRSSLGHA